MGKHHRTSKSGQLLGLAGAILIVVALLGGGLKSCSDAKQRCREAGGVQESDGTCRMPDGTVLQ